MRRFRARRMLTVATLALTAGAAGSPAYAQAGDTAIARDRYPIIGGRALAGVVVYQRRLPDRATPDTPRYIRVIRRRRLPVRSLPRDAYKGFEAIGRDSGGRVVLPFVRETLRNDRLINPRWWLYDVLEDTIQPLRGLPGGACTPVNVAVWRKRLAYQVNSPGCRLPDGIYLRDRRGRRQVTARSAFDVETPLILRGSRLLIKGGAGDDDFWLRQSLARDRVCTTLIEPSVAPPDQDFHVFDAWLTGRDVSWWMEGSAFGSEPPPAGNLILGTRLGRSCGKPAAPTGSYAPLYSRPIAVDNAALYHADGRALYRRDVSAGPSTAPPPNDDFASAQPITGSLPLRGGARVAYATRNADDPRITRDIEGTLQTATRTLWYAYKPTQAGRHFLIVDQWANLGEPLPNGAFSIVSRDTDGPLEEVPTQTRNDRTFAVVDATPTDRYWIGVGCATQGPCYPSFTITITTEAPYWPPDARLATWLGTP